jgi:hypothetical protein
VAGKRQLATLENLTIFSRNILLVSDCECRLRADTGDQPAQAVSRPGAAEGPAMSTTSNIPAPSVHLPAQVTPAPGPVTGSHAAATARASPAGPAGQDQP